MTTYEATRSRERCPTHPGAVLEDIIAGTDLSKTQIAGLLSISRQQLHDIIAERKPISPNIAARIGKLFGNGPGIWLRMQAAYDAWHVEREVDVSGIETLSSAHIPTISSKV